MKALFVIYVDLECWFENISICHNDSEKPSTTKINKHTPSGHLLFTHRPCSESDCYRGEDCIEKFCKTLKNMQKE